MFFDSIQSGDWVDSFGGGFGSSWTEFSVNASRRSLILPTTDLLAPAGSVNSHLFGKSNQLDIEHNRFYDNGSAISAFRIAFDNTYDRGSSANEFSNRLATVVPVV